MSASFETHTINWESNGHAPPRVAPALTGKTMDRLKDVSGPAPVAPAPSRKSKIRRRILVAAGLVALAAGGLWLREWWWVAEM